MRRLKLGELKEGMKVRFVCEMEEIDVTGYITLKDFVNCKGKEINNEQLAFVGDNLFFDGCTYGAPITQEEIDEYGDEYYLIEE